MKSAALLTLFSLTSGVTAFAPSNQRITTTTSSSLVLSSTVDDKTEVREYFNTEGFNRWNKIYSESDDVNSVQMDIRTGHDQTIQKILYWIRADGDIAGKSVCDCGCGVGSLAIPLAQMGKQNEKENRKYHTTICKIVSPTRNSYPFSICIQEQKYLRPIFLTRWRMKRPDVQKNWEFQMPTFILLI